MSKLRTSVSSANKLFVPGINVSELLEFEDYFPDLRRHIASIMIPVVIIAQIRVTLATTKPAVIQSLSSVNMYNRTFLAKSPSLVYVAAAVAIRRTSADYANDTESTRMLEDHTDLITNLSGELSTRGGVAVALGNPAEMRKLRRGYMAQVTGQLQATPVHSPRRLVRDIESVSREDFLSRLPFKTDDLSLDQLFEGINLAISPEGVPVNFVDTVMVNNGTVLLEKGLNITRSAPALPDVSKAPADISSLPAWKRAAIKQARLLEGGK